MRKTLALTAAVLSAITLATPAASAHSDHGVFIEWRAPEDGQRVSGRTVHIKARVAFKDDGVKSWIVEVLAPPGAEHPGFGTVCEEAVGGAPNYVDIDCPWDTTAYPAGGGASQNRQYVVRVSVENANSKVFSPPSEFHRAERRVMVVNPVSAPRDVRLSFSEAGRQATVRWAPNPEPDIVSYLIQERFGSEGWRTVGEAGGRLTSFSRRLSAPGTYRYQVAALRSGGTASDTLQSAWSGPAAEPREIVVNEPPPPVTTTTTAPPYSDGAAPGSDPGPVPPPSEGGPPPPAAVEGGPNPAAPPGAPGDPGAPPGPPVRGPDGLVTSIAPGAPGSVGSKEVSSGHLVDRGGRPTPAAPEPDGPYSETLPYPKQAAPEVAPDDDSDRIARVLVGLPEVVTSEDRRALLVPLAAGLLIFVFAMHALYLSRRADDAPLEPTE
jgi:hypothetical protein